jgi:hypothetical protein
MQIRLGYGLDDRGSIPGRASDGIFPLRHRVQTGSGRSLLSVGSRGVKRRGREADHSAPSNTEVKNA